MSFMESSISAFQCIFSFFHLNCSSHFLAFILLVFFLFQPNILIMCHILQMLRNVNINLYLRPFSIAIYGQLSKLFFLYFPEAINLVLRRKIVQNLIFAYLFFPKSSTIDSRKSSITLE